MSIRSKGDDINIDAMQIRTTRNVMYLDQSTNFSIRLKVNRSIRNSLRLPTAATTPWHAIMWREKERNQTW